MPDRRVRAAEQQATRYAGVRGLARPQQRQRAEIDLEHAHDRHAAAVVRLHRLNAQERQLFEAQPTYSGWWAAHVSEVGRLEIMEGLIALQQPRVERDPPEVSRDIRASTKPGWSSAGNRNDLSPLSASSA